MAVKCCRLLSEAKKTAEAARTLLPNILLDKSNVHMSSNCNGVHTDIGHHLES